MLNPNHGNYFAKIGQAALNPVHFVPGIGPSPDKMLQGRLFFLPNDTDCCRLGAHHTSLASQPPRAIQAGQQAAAAQCAPTAMGE
jgi:catalase